MRRDSTYGPSSRWSPFFAAFPFLIIVVYVIFTSQPAHRYGQ